MFEQVEKNNKIDKRLVLNVKNYRHERRKFPLNDGDELGMLSAD